jgi:hypothetical protein
MSTGYPGSPKLLKGALIQFSAPMLIPVPNIIVFQYNPESLNRKVAVWGDQAKGGAGGAKDPKEENPLVQPFDPYESLTLSLELDAADALEFPDKNPVAVISGVADRIAAMEMLLYPPAVGGATGGLGASVGASLGGAAGGAAGGGASDSLASKVVPVVLFFWGPGRIVPVRINDFSVDEQAFSPTLYPIRAKVSIGLKVLDARAFDNQDQTAAVKIAKACYSYTRAQKDALALANVNNTVDSIMGMLPF